MKKLFFRYFISIFSIAVVVLLVQFGVLLLQYRTSQDRWKNKVYDDFVVSVENAITDGDFTDYGLNGIMMAVSNIDDNRVSGFLLRDASGSNMVAFGKTAEGRMLTSLFSGNQRFQNQVESTTFTGKLTRINIEVTYSEYGVASDLAIGDVTSGKSEIKIPAMLKGQDVIGSIVIAFDGEDSFIIDLLTFSPRTYEYSKDIINSCIKGLMISIPVCLVFALVAAWIISSRNTRYINDVRKALNDLSHGKPNVTVPKQGNSELNEISDAIEELDKDLQANAKSRKAWLSSISHDLNTPTAAMKMIIDGLNDGVFPADESTLRELQVENDKLSERIGRVIEFSNLQADAKPVMENLDASQFISDVLSSFKDAQSVQASATCQSIRCDDSLMSRAVTELLDNAIAARGDSTDPVVWTVGEADGCYRMEITNPGRIPASMDADFFEPWARGDWSRTSGGSGLGLPIASTIVFLHGGQITLTQKEENLVSAVISWPAQA
ncbi:MAG: HAMP domain-containing histidine kinase [Spirochaetales bacterium]|nr:HAMP domain-containing histidine kinase [Spirochaetales bacterium]